MKFVGESLLSKREGESHKEKYELVRKLHIYILLFPFTCYADKLKQ